MSDVLKDVTDAHANYSKLLGDKQNYLSKLRDQIKVLRAEYKQTLSHVAELTGAVNMGSQVIQKLQADVPAPTASSPTTVDGEVV